MYPRHIEDFLARFTLGLLVLYVPIETWISIPGGLIKDPFYLVDVVAMVLMLFGALHSLKARPAPAPGILCAAYAWASANGWRAVAWRAREVREGGALDHGSLELWGVVVATIISLVCFVVSLWLVVRSRDARG